ncbi:MAG TPA: hypothetical protein VM802_16395 [Chitinophaga sp.]|uniref:hypothetical protein n=1 Tax=Chitinophaga sp. TaxID=1869181 RepID=UPI002BCC8BBB|nr:hypothetical protein [Chitinophaga sp.]HVI46457.1 hypothetical protein [Chitinophaga sp.]
MSQPISLIRTIFLTGLLAGTLDILSACTQYFIKTGKHFSGVLTFVASGVFGQDAFTGNPVMPWLGLLFHYCIAMTWTVVFFLFYRYLPADLKKRPLLTGPLYGLCVWLFMSFVVIPNSHVPHGNMRLVSALIGLAIIMVMIGLPIVISATRYYSRSTNS